MRKHASPAMPFGDSSRAGVYRLPQGGIAGLQSAAEQQGLALFRIDLAGINSKDGFLAAVAQALGFPAWFGRNWDALEDCLTDMSWQPARRLRADPRPRRRLPYGGRA